MDSARNDGLGSSLKGAGSGPESGVLVDNGRVIIAGARLHRFQSAHWISTFYTSVKSSQLIGHDEPIFRAIRGPEMIGDASGRPGVWDPLLLFLIRQSDLIVLYMDGEPSTSRSQ